MSLIDVAKRRAAEEALKMVEDGQVIGVGSGTTVEVFLELLKDKLRKEHIRIEAIASSRRIRDLLINMRIPVRTLDEEPEPDLAIDGADEVDLRMNLIKGGGGAHAMEKV
ncbi:MAG: ribose 5-phosphate isomerase A, partial [Thermoprotei archaeon]